MTQDTFIAIGKITSSHGLKGEVKIYLFTDPNNLKLYKNFYLEKTENIAINIRHNTNKNIIIAKINNISDRNTADTLKNKMIYIKRSQLAKIDDQDNFYVSDLINVNIINQKNTVIGKIIDVKDHGAGDNIIIEFNDHTISEYPFLKQYFPTIDLKNQKILFIPPEII